MRRSPFSSNKWVLLSLAALLLLALLIQIGNRTPPPHKTGAMLVEQGSVPLPETESGDTWAQVRRVLDRRCVVCHGCYDAPCQLKISSMEGLRRGASEILVYDVKRISPIEPTRLFIDARSVSEWRQRGFHPVLNEGRETPSENLNSSVMYHLLRLKQQHPQPDGERLPDSFTLELNRKQTCPGLKSVAEFSRDHPLWGMPYAMPNLKQQEFRTLVSWLERGAPSPGPAAPSTAVLRQIGQWEAFLNGTGNKQRLVSRYLYEHLFHAHIHFTGSPSREFYRLVRSTTPPGQPIDEIATVRPYDDPGSGGFYYRLLHYTPSIVVKNHIVYEFSKQRLQRYRMLFLKPDYEVPVLPSYQPELASNPFKVFAAIPTASRYQFLLDDAHFFIEGFIKGPVCRGQIALNVIEDRFWVFFFNPGQSVFTNDSQFIGEMADDLQLPDDRPGSLDLTSIWTDYWKRQRKYMATKQSLFEKFNTHDINHALGFIWDGGDGKNPNAALTVFRHFDSGSVAYGLVGDNPKTAWVIDYPLFERIHYLLVAGFNVYGNFVHQINTRIYMDFLRMEGEDYFLAFLPASHRKAIRDSWYTGLRSGVEELFRAPEAWLKVNSVSGYLSKDPQRELYRYLRKRFSATAPRALAMNHCGNTVCPDSASAELAGRLSLAMKKLARIRGEKLHDFPDVAYVHVRMGDSRDDTAYTLIRNKAYHNVTSFLAGRDGRGRADLKNDSMTVVDWLEGSYPNFFFSVALSEVDAFIERCTSIRDHQDYDTFVDRYGIRRTNPAFWPAADWFQDEYARSRPVSSGLFDLNRYKNQ